MITGKSRGRHGPGALPAGSASPTLYKGLGLTHQLSPQSLKTVTGPSGSVFNSTSKHESTHINNYLKKQALQNCVLPFPSRFLPSSCFLPGRKLVLAAWEMRVLTGESETYHVRIGRLGLRRQHNGSDVGKRRPRLRQETQKELGRESKRQNIFFKMLPQVDILPRKGEDNFLLHIFPKTSSS